jgi:hypothetical protein
LRWRSSRLVRCRWQRGECEQVHETKERTAIRTVEHDADEHVGEQDRFEALPERVQEALGELAGAAKEGLLALSVGVGLGVLAELMAEEVDEIVGPKGKHNPDRSAVRHGDEAGEVTLGGRRVPVNASDCSDSDRRERSHSPPSAEMEDKWLPRGRHGTFGLGRPGRKPVDAHDQPRTTRVADQDLCVGTAVEVSLLASNDLCGGAQDALTHVGQLELTAPLQ